jgi:hypothetical protein
MNPRNPISPVFSEWEFLGQRILKEISRARGGPVTSNQACAVMLCGVHPHLTGNESAPEINRLLASLRKSKPTWTRHLLNKISRWWNTESPAGRARRDIVSAPVYQRHPSRIITTIEAENEQLRLRYGPMLTPATFTKLIQRLDDYRPSEPLWISKKLNAEIQRLKSKGHFKKMSSSTPR